MFYQYLPMQSVFGQDLLIQLLVTVGHTYLHKTYIYVISAVVWFRVERCPFLEAQIIIQYVEPLY